MINVYFIFQKAYRSESLTRKRTARKPSLKAYRSESSAPKPIYRPGARSAQRPASFACAGSPETNRQRRRPALTSRGYREAERAELERRGALVKRLRRKKMSLNSRKSTPFNDIKNWNERLYYFAPITSAILAFIASPRRLRATIVPSGPKRMICGIP